MSWRLDFERLNKAQAVMLGKFEEQGEPAGLSAISLRGPAKMIQRRRISVGTPLAPWLDGIAAHPLLTILRLTASIAAESVRLGNDFPRDPADQIIVATALCHGLTLITADDRIRKWGKVRVV